MTATGINEIKLWDVRTAALLRTLEPDGTEIMAAQFSRDGKSVFVASNNNGHGRLYLWNNATGEMIWSLSTPGERFNDAILLPDATRAITVSDGGVVRTWRTSLDRSAAADTESTEIIARAIDLLRLYNVN